MTALLAEAARHPAPGADDVEVSWITPDAVEQSLQLGGAWSVPFECGLPVRRFTARKGQRHLSGLWWCATTGGHVGFESWLERDQLMLLDFDPAVSGIASQPLWMRWAGEDGRPGTARRDVAADRLAALTGRPAQHLSHAMPELRAPAPDWTAWRHQTQPRCPRCDARHEGGPVVRLLPHHRYVCTRHSYWIGPPDAGQPATTLGWQLQDVVRAQRCHLRLVRRHGFAAAYDAVLTGFLICGHLWGDQPQTPVDAWHRWTLRAEVLIPTVGGAGEFSASKLFAAVYPEAVDIAALIATPAWRRLAAGDTEQQRRFIAEIGLRLGRPDYQPTEGGDAIAHWMKFDSERPPSKPHKLFPDTREHGSTRQAKTSPQSPDRQDRSAFWFHLNRRGGSLLLHHRHIKPVLIRDWSRPMDGIAATIWASGTTMTTDSRSSADDSARTSTY